MNLNLADKGRYHKGSSVLNFIKLLIALDRRSTLNCFYEHGPKESTALNRLLKGTMQRAYLTQ